MEKITRMQAAKEGRSRFFTGNKCKHGHVSERYVSSGACIECCNAAKVEYNRKIVKVMRAARETEGVTA